MKRLTAVFCFLLLSASLPVKAKSGFEIQGLNNIEMHWNGSGSSLETIQNFCIRIDSSLTPPLPSQLNDADIKYNLQLQGQGGDVFYATQAGNNIPLSFQLDTGTRSFEMTPRQDSGEVQGTALCDSPGSNLQLQVSTLGELNDIPSGDYRTTLTLLVTDSRFGTQESKDFDVTISIPRLISIRGDDEIDLKTFTGRNSPKGQAGLCIFRNGAGYFRLKAEGGENRSFKVWNHDRKTSPPLGYQVNVSSESITRKNIEPSEMIRGFRGSSSRTCAGDRNLTVEAVIPKAWAENAYAGYYQGLLKITVEVE
ncbi:MAG: hypothetical protein ACR2PT_11190 [Endozoicomonas sp.]